MKRAQWFPFLAAVMSLCVAAMARAQSDDLFDSESKALAEPAQPAAVDDIFGRPIESQPRNQNPAGPTPTPAEWLLSAPVIWLPMLSLKTRELKNGGRNLRVSLRLARREDYESQVYRTG